jgi:hypothetical protein
VTPTCVLDHELVAELVHNPTTRKAALAFLDAWAAAMFEGATPGASAMTTNLHAASQQWATRPDDQRFLSLGELAASVSTRCDLSRAVDVRLDSLTLNQSAHGDLLLTSPDGQTVPFTNWSFGQLASLVGAPASYLRRLPAPLARVNLEWGLEGSDAGREQAKLLYQPPVESATDGQVRAFTSTTYGRIWDIDVVRAVERINQDDRWRVPLKAYGGQNSMQATTLYASDRDVFIFLVDEDRPIDSGGQTYFRGFLTWNSEVGKAAFGLQTFLYSYVCANRIIWGARDVEELRIRHTSLAPDRFVEQAQPALVAMSEASPQPIVEAIRNAKTTRVGKTVADVEAWLAGKGFGRAESTLAITLAQRGGETGSSGDPTNMWDLIQGGTAAARAIGHADSRLEQERRWSSLLREPAA